MPPLHLHTTVYAPVVSPPTPAPSPGPVQTFDLLPSPGSSPTSSENFEHETTTTERGPVIRRQFLSSLLASCTPEELLFISATIAPRLKRDFLFCLPTELALHVLSFIEDPRTLARAEQVSQHWRTLVNEESVWKRMCEVHGFDDWNNDNEPFEEEPLEEMEQFANFPMDPALEWLITKRRQEIGDRKGKAKQSTPSYRSHFRNCYITMTNWRKGGHLLRSHRITTESETVTSLALDPDWVVIGLANSRIQVYSAKTGVLAKTLIGHESGVWSLSLVWDVDTGECLHVLQGHFQQIYSVAFDGKYIASGGLDTTVRLWDADTGNCIALLQGHTALVCQLQLSPTLLITGGSDGRVITFSLETLNISHRIAAHDCSVTSLQFVDDGGSRDNFLVTGGNDGRVRLYEVQTGNYVRDVSEGGEGIWRVVVGWGVCVVVCKRGGKSVVEIWSMRPEGPVSGSAGGGAITATSMSRSASGSGGFGLSGGSAMCSISPSGSGHPVASEIPLADLLREEEAWRRRSDDGEDTEPSKVRRAASG
ncbi:hypothetical protein EST38_g8283 [Candolleomyces aberdarensis]|uniref:F-box domain-containing protein n=1 Tax=Candolleomyces aberdarensis TaxID=2316362 RepID=A0A4Q2DF15_9AGAR|nr:hypothetical protein EST38_g8283 [Candolleomyces aberdarensis]